MSKDPYNSIVRDCFDNPSHSGDLPGGASAYFDDQGMQIRLSANVVDGGPRELRFQAWGCPHVIAASEYFCRQFEGRPIGDLAQFETADIMRDLAVPVEKTGRIIVLEDTVRSLRAAISDQIARQRQD